jgi:hypothetical protein
MILPAPECVAYGDFLRVDKRGRIHARSAIGLKIIETLRLDAAEYTKMRRRILDTISEATHGGKTLEWCLGFPDDLPNLAQERKPAKNTRPEGTKESYYERKLRGELPEYY